MKSLLTPLILMVALVLPSCVPIAEAQENMTINPDVNPLTRDLHSEPLPAPVPMADPDRAQLDQAVAAGSNAALLMFLSRYPDSRLAPEARADLKARKAPDAPGVAERVAESDAALVIAFDRARLSGNPGEVSAFIARYAPHPLAQEARFLPY
jgi:hypothetical protein